MQFDIRQGSPLEAYAVACEIPEFGNQAYDLEEYRKRLVNTYHILIGFHQNQPVGFKAGYQRGSEGQFYSWMGGVIPAFRKYGLAKELALKQEAWAREKGYKSIWFKTRNRNREMLHFAINHGFNVTEVQPKPNIEDYRIILEKSLFFKRK